MSDDNRPLGMCGPGWGEGEILSKVSKQPTANDRQEGGSHYKSKAVQPWDFIHRNGIGFLAGNVIKYVVRYKDKNGIADLKKARHYLDKLIEETQE